jgi:predicted Rossmann fold nucleotide-binding protein DprA/Smf involved in DNA uptake
MAFAGWQGEVDGAVGWLPSSTAVELVARGRWPSARPRVALIGSRAAAAPQLTRATELAQTVIACGGTVVSGGAFGIDAAVLQACVDGGQPGLAVLPRPPDQPYPPAHAPLYAQLLEQGGGLLAPAIAAGPLPRWAFARRNLLLVGLVDVVVAVAAGLPSGTLLAVTAALRAGKPVAHVPWPDGGQAEAGSQLLTRLGLDAVEDGAGLARWLAACAAADQPRDPAIARSQLRALQAAVLRRRPMTSRLRPPVRPVDAAPSPPPSYACEGDTVAVALLRQVVQQAGPCGLTLEGIVECTGMARATTAADLLALVLCGDVVQRGDGAYVAAYRTGQAARSGPRR